MSNHVQSEDVAAVGDESAQLDQLLSDLGLDLIGGGNKEKKQYKLLSVNNKDVKNHSGRYNNYVPSLAAKKAFSRILKDAKASKKDNYKASFKIIEVKQGGDKKVFAYTGINKKLKTPVKYEIAGTKITVTHEGIIKMDK